MQSPSSGLCPAVLTATQPLYKDLFFFYCDAVFGLNKTGKTRGSPGNCPPVTVQEGLPFLTPRRPPLHKAKSSLASDGCLEEPCIQD